MYSLWTIVFKSNTDLISDRQIAAQARDCFQKVRKVLEGVLLWSLKLYRLSNTYSIIGIPSDHTPTRVF